MNQIKPWGDSSGKEGTSDPNEVVISQGMHILFIIAHSQHTIVIIGVMSDTTQAARTPSFALSSPNLMEGKDNANADTTLNVHADLRW